MTDTMLPQSQPTTVPTGGKLGSTASSATLTPITPAGATTRHAGDALWPWLLGLVLIGGLGYLAFRAANARPKAGEASPGLPVGGEAPAGSPPVSGESEGGVVSIGRSRRGDGLTSFASARPARLKYPPKGYRRGARVRRLSEEQFTRPSASRYNLEVEE
jgi:hypothetical protein